jgi:CDP-diacylglycerol--serine O-phosphatidyltransferase
MTGTGSEFGVQLDSLADVVSFGVAPTILLYEWALADLGPFGIAICAAFMICGIMRLARFNLKTSGGKKVVSSGLPITAAGGLIAVMVMTHSSLGNISVANPVNPALLTIALCGLMISEVPYRLLAELRRSKAGIALVGTLLVTGLGVGLKYDVAIFLFGFGFIYVASGPLLMLKYDVSALDGPHSDSDE